MPRAVGAKDGQLLLIVVMPAKECCVDLRSVIARAQQPRALIRVEAG
jgi:hypothetical protein